MIMKCPGQKRSADQESRQKLQAREKGVIYRTITLTALFSLFASFSSFLKPLLTRGPSLYEHDCARIITSPKSQPSSPHTSITASLLGQFGADGEVHIGTGLSCGDLESDPGGSDDTQCVITRIYGKHKLGDPKEFILNERLDDRESLLMDGTSILCC